MKRKITALCVVIAMLAVAILGGTMAYFTDTDEAVNVMTMGNVKIEQIEQEWKDGALVDFTQEKELLPFVPADPSSGVVFSWDANTVNTENGAYRRMGMKNMIDKYVSVKNTGKSDAFVRTFLAFEMGDATADEWKALVGRNYNKYDGNEFKFPGTWDWSDGFEAEINGENYYVYVAVHLDAVKPGKTTIPSLNQFYLKNTATNEDAAMLDGNGNGLYEVLAFSEAVQAKGFENAEQALNTAFYTPGPDAHPWGGYAFAGSTEDLEAAIASGAENIVINDGNYELSGNVNAIITGTSGTVIDIVGNIQNINIKNATINGVNSINVGADNTAVFENVVFADTLGIVAQSVVKGDMTFIGCTFENGFHIDSSNDDVTVTFENCTFTDQSYIKLGGSADYVFNNCVIETLASNASGPWGRQWVVAYSDVTYTNCSIGRISRAGAALTFTFDGCVDENGNAITADKVHAYNSPTIVIK